MQIRKTYKDLKPELLYDEVRDLVLKQGAINPIGTKEQNIMKGGE